MSPEKRIKLSLPDFSGAVPELPDDVAGLEEYLKNLDAEIADQAKRINDQLGLEQSVEGSKTESD